MEENIVRKKSFEFALETIRLYCKLREEKEYVISRQLLRSGTSIGANIEEAVAAQSRNDFIAKMSIASKEARETKYWLRLLDRSDLTQVDVAEALRHIEDLIRLLTAIVKSTQERR